MSPEEIEYYNMSSEERHKLYGRDGKRLMPLNNRGGTKSKNCPHNIDTRGLQIPNLYNRYNTPTTYPATILEPFNNVDEDIVVQLDNRSDYELFIKAKKDYTLDVDVQDEDNATIRVEVFLESSGQSYTFAKMIDKIDVRRRQRSNGLCSRYSYSYSSWFSTVENRSLTINVCPEYLVQEMTWFMEMMEMNGFDLVPSKAVVEVEDKPVEKWYNKKLTEREALAVFAFCAFACAILLMSVLSIIKWFTT